MDQEIAQCLQGTLSPDPNTRIAAELRLGELQANGEAGLSLARLTAAQGADLYLRQAAGLSLRKYVRERWSPYFDHFKGPAPSPELKDQIRATLLQAVADPERKVRLACAYALSTIAGPDYPDQFPNLLPHLQELLHQGHPDAVHGAMALLTDFVKTDMDETQLMQVAKEMLPSMMRVFGDAERYSGHTRARTLLVFRQCLTTLYMVKDSYPEVSRQATEAILPEWLQAITQLLSSDPASELAQGEKGWEGLAIRNEAFKTLKVANMFPKLFRPHLESFVRLSLSNLAALLPTFQTVYLSTNSDASAPSTPEGDADVAVGVPELACSIIDFVSESTRADRCRALFVSGGSGGTGAETEVLQALVYHTLSYVQMTADDEETWANDVNAFVADEDEETLTYSLRIAAGDLLANLVERYPHPTLRCLSAAVQRRVAEANEARARGEEDWWKVQEGCLTAVGAPAEAITEILTSVAAGKDSLNIEALFSEIVMPNVDNAGVPFLQGRCFVFASQYADALPVQLAQRFLEAAVKAIELDSTSVPVKISAVRTVKNFFRHLSADLVSPFTQRIISQLGPLLGQASEDTLVLLLETIQSVVAEGDEQAEAGSQPPLDPSVIGDIAQAALTVWQPNARDPILLSVVSDLLESLAGLSSATTASIVIQRSIPALATAIASADGTEPSAVAESAVELARSVLAGAKPDSLRGAVPMLCPSLIEALMRSEDRDVLQNGIECLTLLVRKSFEELMQWHDAHGTGAVEAMLKVVARLLAPSESESGGLAIGDLVIALLRKAGDQVLPVLPELLRAMVTRLAAAKTASFSQSLILPFAYLMHAQMPVVLDLLESVQIPLESNNTVSGLEVLSRKWVEDADTFQGFWAQRVSTVALARLLESGRPMLNAMTVQGDLIPDTSNVIRTRSRAKTMPHQYTQIPLAAKIVKLLVRDYEQAQKAPGVPGLGRDGARTPVSDDEDGEWDDEDEPSATGKKDEMAFLSDMLGEGGFSGFEDDDLLGPEEDEELQADPLYTMDLKAYLASYFQQQASSPNSANFLAACQYLTAEEQQRLRAAAGH